MGDFNSTSPALQGLEWRPSSIRSLVAGQPVGLAQRFKSPGAVTVTAIHRFLLATAGTPGLAVEILDTLQPAVTTVAVAPGTDTGATVTNWKDNTGGAANFGDIDDSGGINYITNSTALGPLTSDYRRLSFRGSIAALSGVRITAVRIRAAMLPPGAVSVGGVAPIWMKGVLNIGGVDYFSSTGAVGLGFDGISGWGYVDFVFPNNPATGLPWTLTAINAFLNAATDEFGVDVRSGSGGSLAIGGFQIGQLYLNVDTVPENRRGFFYSTATPASPRWVSTPMSGGVVLAANTWYWVHLFPLTPNNGIWSLTVPILKDPNVVMATSPAATTGEHRQVQQTSWSPFSPGLITGFSAAIPGEMIPLLIDVGGTIQSQSQPYAQLGSVVGESAIVGVGQTRAGEVTSAAGATTYGSVLMSLGWEGTLAPDAALVIEIRHGAGLDTGGGTLDATGSILASQTVQALTNTPISLTVPFATAAGATQYAIYCKSAASAGRGWRVGILDTRSDVVTTTTVANVEGATQGGQTDGWADAAGTRKTRYDLAAALVQPPTAPAGFVATPLVAV